MKPIFVDVTDIHDMISSHADVLKGTFLTPLHLLCLVVTYATELRMIIAEDTLDDANIDLWNEVNNFMPRSVTDDKLNDMLNFICCEVKPYVEKTLLAQLDNNDVPLCKMYGFPVTSGIMVLLDEDGYDDTWQELYNTYRPNR